MPQFHDHRDPRNDTGTQEGQDVQTRADCIDGKAPQVYLSKFLVTCVCNSIKAGAEK